MTETIIYSVLLVALLAHVIFAFKMYWTIHRDKSLSLHEQNQWKLKALIFPAYFWRKYLDSKK